ncbi:MAG: hypothetical protein QOG68_1278, partial [Solirubrobacteraceae bacterium]|nr:hypothetical protein [Solirubrobacteraceae bacterium]
MTAAAALLAAADGVLVDLDMTHVDSTVA